jgi:hypothetical protein
MATKQRLPRTALLCHEIMLAILPAAKKPSDSGSSVRNLRPLCFSAPLRQIEPPLILTECHSGQPSFSAAEVLNG